MRNFSNYFLLFCLLFIHSQTTKSQTSIKSASDIAISLQKLDKLGSVLYFAAHPDDENTRLIAWLAQEKKYRTAYLSLTRGDGGQNLLGTDLGINLGLIRTQELLSARKIDKGEQFFSSAFDFGFSKTHQETFQFWDHQTALREAVWIIRKFQPDVIITRFPPDKRGGHGHHQASAILAHEAFLAAADKTKFPEQLTTVSTWQAKRLLWNTANFGGQNNTSEDQLKVDIGHYNALLGLSYGEIAAHSRSQHKSQGFGSASSRGSSIEYFEHVAGQEATQTLFDGIETSWNRIPHSAGIQQLIGKINSEFDPNAPQQTVNDLLKLNKALSAYQVDSKNPNAANQQYWIAQKQKETQELIMACAGIWIDAFTAEKQQVVNQDFTVRLEAVVRNTAIQAELIKVNQQQINQHLETNRLWQGSVPYKSSTNSQPYWLLQEHTRGKFNIELTSVGYPTNPDVPKAEFTFKINGELLEISQEIKQRYVDPVKGEMHDPLVILPELTAEANSSVVLSKNLQQQHIDVTFTRHLGKQNKLEVAIDPIDGWKLSDNKFLLDFTEGNSITKTIALTPLSAASKKAVLRFKYKGETLRHIKTLRYGHIPSLVWFPLTEIICHPISLENPVKRIAYLAGAGDLVAESMQQIGMQVSTLSQKDIQLPTLQQFDAIVVGIRYFNVVDNSAQTLKKLLEYVKNGGVLLMQYNVNGSLKTRDLGPFPFALSRDRVTQEDAEVRFDAKDPALNYPNKISTEDFEGWVQERGLYFAENIDSKYRTPLEMNDTAEQGHKGSLLITKLGKGKFVYTSLSFFRQLPAGVPGAYRLFVNLLTKEK